MYAQRNYRITLPTSLALGRLPRFSLILLGVSHHRRLAVFGPKKASSRLPASCHH